MSCKLADIAALVGRQLPDVPTTVPAEPDTGISPKLHANSEAFSHVKISSTRLIAHLKAREKLSFTMLVADFRGAQKNHKSQKNCSMSTVFLRNIQG